jgi:hypothetical protein
LTIDAMDLMCMGCPLLEDLELTCQLAFINPEEHLLHAPFNFPTTQTCIRLGRYRLATSHEATE